MAEICPGSFEVLKNVQQSLTLAYVKSLEYPENLVNVHGWFVSIKIVEMWYDDEDYWSDDNFAKLHNGYENRKRLKNRDKESCDVQHGTLLITGITVCQRTTKRN